MNYSLKNTPRFRIAFFITTTLLITSIIINLFQKVLITRHSRAKDDLTGKYEILSTGLRNVWQMRETIILDKHQKYFLMQGAPASFEDVPDTVLKSKICIVISLKFCNDCIREVVKELNNYYNNSGKDVIFIAHESEVTDISKLLLRHGSEIPIISINNTLIQGLDESKIHFPYLFFVDDRFNVMHFMVLDKEGVFLLKEYLYYKKKDSEYWFSKGSS